MRGGRAGGRPAAVRLRSRARRGCRPPGLERITRRSADNAPIAAELLATEQRDDLNASVADLAPSYVHMHVNRMIRSAQRPHEVVLYDLIVRLYESRVARAKQRSPS